MYDSARAAMAAVVWLAASGCALAGVSPADVTITSGALKGVIAGDVASFKAIPYAAAPVGDLRWRAPQPPARWKGVRPADAFGPACIQTPGASAYAGPQSEDCLTLNIWTPAHRTGARLPVMVWIHGGGFVGGTGARYDGASFARDGVVLVTINYRLGRLGFFAHPALAKTNPEGDLADFGMMDQLAALKWVKANIGAFGGDPANVTVFGESAGGVFVNYLMISPAARGLFARAISESGFGRVQGRPLGEAQARGAAFAAALGVRGDGVQAAKALRALPAAALAAPAKSLTDPDAPGPILDGVAASQNVAAAFAKGDQAKVPYLVGGNSFEASLFRFVQTNPDYVLQQLGANRDMAVRFFGDGDPVKAAVNLVTLSQVIEPDRYLARQNAANGAPAYVYYFSYVPEALRATMPGAGHGAEVAYVFQLLPKAPIDRPAGDTRLGPRHIPAATPPDEAIAAAMHAYWVAFAKTGDPDSAGGPAWPQASGEGDPLMEFGSDGPVVRRDFEKAKLDILAAVAKSGKGAQAPPPGD
jgi:para-nitrobenzyl esterase